MLWICNLFRFVIVSYQKSYEVSIYMFKFLVVISYMCVCTVQDVLRSLESHQQIFQRIHKDRSVDGVPVPPDQLQDMAER